MLIPIKALYEYNEWANRRILDAASELTSIQYTKNLGSSYISIEETLIHIMSAEAIWFMRCKGFSPKTMFQPADFPDISSLKSRWAEVTSEQSVFIANLHEESLNNKITYANFTGESFTYTLWQILHHVINHSSYHRGQIITMLRQLGVGAVATDFLLYYDLES